MMKLYLLFGLSLAMLISGGHTVTLTIKNNCRHTIWPATLTANDKRQLQYNGFELAPQASKPIGVPAPWEGRVWARTQCSTSSGRFSCATADCGSGQVSCNGNGGAPPASLAELNLAKGGGQDYFDISLVDGFNLPVKIAPQGGTGSTCTTTSCAANVNSVCPPDLANRGRNGNIISCKSACVAFGQPRYCCTGDYNKLETCPPTHYSRIFKSQCPQAYSYAYDRSATFSCFGRPNYEITFCP